jgi:hypothetical protein
VFLLVPADVVDEREAEFSEYAGALRNSREPHRHRGLQLARHHERDAVILLAQTPREREVFRERRPPARNVEGDRLSHARHEGGQRRGQLGGQHIHWPARKPRVEQTHDRVAANEVADPHIGHDQDRPALALFIIHDTSLKKPRPRRKPYGESILNFA